MQKIFDGHFHIIDSKYPLEENNGFLPDFYTTNNYLQEIRSLNINVVGGVVVSGSFQSYHQEYFKTALKQLGKNFVGITQLPTTVTDKEIYSLNAIGIRGIRFNLYRGFTVSLNDINILAKRVYDLCGWSTEFYLNIDTADSKLLDLISTLPKTSIDHLGMNCCPTDKLKKVLSNGTSIRVSGFGRIEYTTEELLSLIPQLYKENNSGLIFGTDFPATRARFRFSINDLNIIKQSLNQNEVAINNVLFRNGMNWYLSNNH